MVDAATPRPALAALAGVGLQISSDPHSEGGPAYVVSGNTFHYKDVLKAYGGRWSKSRGAWVFDDPQMIDRLGEALNGGATVAAPGFAEAPMHFQPSAAVSRLERAANGAKGAEPPHYWGHRKRLRARFMNGEGGALPDYELLERMLLFFSIRYVDVKPLAKRLLETFGSLGGVLAAEPGRLDHVMQSISGTEGAQIEKDAYFTITHLKAMRQLLERVLAEEVKQRPVTSSWQALLDYLKVALGHEPIEQFRLLFLDKKNILIEDRSAVQPSQAPGENAAHDQSWKYSQALDDIQQRGTVDHTPLYPREIAKRALELWVHQR